MGVLIKKREGAQVLTKIGRLSFIVLIVAISSSLIDTIWALYIDSFVHNVAIVGFISAFLTLIAFCSYFVFVPIIESSSKSKIFSFSLAAFATTYILFAINKNLYVFVILAFVLTILHTFRIMSFGIIIKDKSKKTQLSINEGLVYTFMNTGWVIGPLIAGYVAEESGINMVFVLSAIFISIAFIMFKISKIKDTNIKKTTHSNIIKNFLDFFKDKNRVLSYILSGGVNLWWVLIYLFMPLYIIRNGLHDLWVGYFLFAIAVPLIVFEYKFAKIAGKKGFKKIFKTGFFIVMIISLSCFFVNNVYVMLGLLALASVGIAMLEPTTEAYFFDILKKNEECRFYGPYNTTIDANQFIGKILASVLLVFLPFKFIFLLFSFLMFLLFLLSFKAKNIVEKRRR